MSYDIVRLECEHKKCGILCDVKIRAERKVQPDRMCASGLHPKPELGRCLECKAQWRRAHPATEAQRAARKAKGYGNQRRS